MQQPWVPYIIANVFVVPKTPELSRIFKVLPLVPSSAVPLKGGNCRNCWNTASSGNYREPLGTIGTVTFTVTLLIHIINQHTTLGFSRTQPAHVCHTLNQRHNHLTLRADVLRYVGFVLWPSLDKIGNDLLLNL